MIDTVRDPGPPTPRPADVPPVAGAVATGTVVTGTVVTGTVAVTDDEVLEACVVAADTAVPAVRAPGWHADSGRTAMPTRSMTAIRDRLA
ncbi:hypothetical protein [Frankia sp. CiP3]|uniref:hypothetical protein n=1 Tax=Frankia sp. CiP3 TaxID=2880971 RepID=UPI001EF455EF|nr:hypothetical protein [Frankia sp. CiP3]